MLSNIINHFHLVVNKIFYQKGNINFKYIICNMDWTVAIFVTFK